MKRIVSIVACMCLLGLICSCGKDAVQKNNTKNDTNIETTKTNTNYSEEIKKVENRAIFSLKNSDPQKYSTNKNDISTKLIYKENWKYNQVLSEKHFDDIKWYGETNNGIKVVTFQGVSITTNVKIKLQFWLSEHYSLPMGVTFALMEPYETLISVEDYVLLGQDYSTAMLNADIAISVLISRFVNYEGLADECLDKGSFDKAITYYKEGEVLGEKLKRAYYLKAEKYLSVGSIDIAIDSFENAKPYKDSAERIQKIYYEQGQKYEDEGDFLKAMVCYTSAKPFADSDIKCKECSYNQGLIFFGQEEYEEAIRCFGFSEGYKDTEEKIKESHYILAEGLLSVGKVENAKNHIEQIIGYKDASDRISRYYYEEGEKLVQQFKYLDAVELFVAAGDYLDAETMIKECYYKYGTSQIDVDNATLGISYLEMCKGYKDSDDLIMAYYYAKAKDLYDLYMATGKDFDWKTELTYEKVYNALTLCIGYEDTVQMIKVLQWVNDFWISAEKAFKMLCKENAREDITHIEKFSVNLEEGTIKLTEKNLTKSHNDGVTATIKTNFDKSYFEVDVENLFDGSPWGRYTTFIIRDIMACFAEKYEDEELKNNLKYDKWVKCDNENYENKFYYEGYDVVITAYKKYAYNVVIRICANKTEA